MTLKTGKEKEEATRLFWLCVAEALSVILVVLRHVKLCLQITLPTLSLSAFIWADSQILVPTMRLSLTESLPIQTHVGDMHIDAASIAGAALAIPVVVLLVLHLVRTLKQLKPDGRQEDSEGKQMPVASRRQVKTIQAIGSHPS